MPRLAYLLPLFVGLPLAAAALPEVGAIVGTNADAARAALEAAGCPVISFELEDGRIEAKCTDAATGAELEIYIDPATGAVTEIKAEDD